MDKVPIFKSGDKVRIMQTPIPIRMNIANRIGTVDKVYYDRDVDKFIAGVILSDQIVSVYCSSLMKV